MNRQCNTFNTEIAALYHGVQNLIHIEIGANGYSLCRYANDIEGNCLIEGIQDLGVAHELTEMLIGELENAALEAQRNPCIVYC